MRKIYLLSFIKVILLIFVSGSYSVIAQQISNCPASPYPIDVKQADSSVLTIVGKGGMLNSWTETIDKYSIIKRNGIYEYATKVNGKLVASGMRAKNPNARTSTEKIFLQKRSKSLSPDAPSFTDKAAFYPSLNTSAPAQVGYSSKGNLKALLILIRYPDLFNTYTKANFNNLMNESNYRGTGSFKDFYSTSSFGQLNVTTDVFGWYNAAHNYSYYGYSNGFVRSTNLVREAVNAAEAAGVDFSKYDNDGDGVVDGIIVAHAGPGAEEGSQGQYIWSHRWVLSAGGNQVVYDGVLINDYIMNPERRIFTADMVGRGVFCHEFGHNLGLPDLYDTDGGSEGLGEWSLMASANWLGNEHTPGNMCAWCRDQLGWIHPTVLSANSSCSLNAASGSNQVFRINTALTNEYFLLENRQKTGLDISLNGSGLAIFHVNTNFSGNADEDHKQVDLEEADGFSDLDNQANRGDAGDLFPGSSGNKAFTNSSNPNSKSYTGANTNINVSNISVDGTGKVLFDFNITGMITDGILEAEESVLSGAVVASGRTGFTGSGYADYLNSSGEFIEWTVNATTAGPFFLKFRYANGGRTDRPLQLKINETEVNASLAFAPTDGWTNWSVSSITANLIAGSNKIRLTTIGTSGPNVDHLVATVSTGKLEAEKALLKGAVVASGVAGFTGSGYADYLNSSGDFIEWTVNAEAEGPYSLKFRYANGGITNRPLQLQINGVEAKASVNFLPTGGWPVWSVSSAAGNLIAGQNKIRLTTIGYNGPNVDNLSAIANTGKLEAEEAAIKGAVIASKHGGFTGSGFVDYLHASGDFIEWSVNASTADLFLLQFRYANGGATNRPLQLQVNGVVVNGGLDFFTTGSWTNWLVSGIYTKLVSGTNKIRLTTIGFSGANIDHLAFSKNNSIQSVERFVAGKTVLPQSDLFKAYVTPNPVAGNAKLIVSASSDLPVDFQLVDMLGRNYKSLRLPFRGSNTFDFSVTDLSPGAYIIILKQGILITHARLIVAGK